MYWFLEHSIHHLRSCRFRSPSKIPSSPVIVIAVRPEIPHLLRDNFTFPLVLLLALFNFFILVDSIHQQAYTRNRFPSERLS